MKLNQLAMLWLFAATCAVILATGCCGLTVATKPSAVQIDLGNLLNARVVTTQADGRLQLADHSLDRGHDSVLITKSGAELAQAGKLNPLPDSGFFAANDEHPDVQLPYGTAGAGPQVHQSAAKTETYSLPIPPNHYAQMQLYFISAAGPTPISVSLQYADGSSDQRTTEVTDFYFLPKSLSENSGGCCFWAKSWMARRDDGEYPSWVFDRGATKPAGCLLENPSGGRSFGCGPCWLGCYSPLWGCSFLAALPTSKIPRRSTPRNFQTDSQTYTNNWIVLTGDFGKVNLNARMTESVHHYIHGYNLNPDATKVLQQIVITKEPSGSVLNLFGATGSCQAKP